MPRFLASNIPYHDLLWRGCDLCGYVFIGGRTENEEKCPNDNVPLRVLGEDEVEYRPELGDAE